MSFTIRIKEEIAMLTSSPTTNKAELSGFIRNSATISKKEIKFSTENKFIINRVGTLFEELYNTKVETSIINNVNFSKKDLYQVIINQNIEKILINLGIFDDNKRYLKVIPEYLVDGNEEIRGYLKGVFFACGSINDPKTSRYHMELLIAEAEEAVFVQKLLNIFDLNAKILNREKGYMIYIKEAEKISDFLKIIGATKAVLYYENERVYREQKNKTNRLNNCEQANTDKIIQTAADQLEDINIIEKYDGVELLDDRVREALNYRKKYPETSLKELAEIISIETNKKITKSGLNHRLRKIKELAEKFRKMQKEGK